MLTIATWLWGTKFSADDVAKLVGGLRRNLRRPFRFLLIADRPFSHARDYRYVDSMIFSVAEIPPEDRYLLERPGCLARLRMFDPVWQQAVQIDDRLVCVDLDTVITGELDPLFARVEPFVIMQGGNAANPCPYNGALMMLRRGCNPHVWREFSIDAVAKTPFFEFPDDQGWLAAKLPGAAGWKCGSESGVYVFRKPGWPESTNELPAGARLVTFNGRRQPAGFAQLPWVEKHWRP